MQIDGAAAMIRHFEYLFLGKRLMQGDLTHRTGAGEPARPPARDMEQPLVPLEAAIQQVRMMSIQQVRVMQLVRVVGMQHVNMTGAHGLRTPAHAHSSYRMARHDVSSIADPGTVG